MDSFGVLVELALNRLNVVFDGLGGVEKVGIN